MDGLYGVEAKHSRAGLAAPEPSQACPFFLIGIMKTTDFSAAQTWQMPE
jgi:hypothetical protein